MRVLSAIVTSLVVVGDEFSGLKGPVGVERVGAPWRAVGSLLVGLCRCSVVLSRWPQPQRSQLR